MRFLPVYKKYREDVDFLMIYVREAHPTDKWWLAETKFMRLVSVLSNPYPSYDTREPRTIEERRAVASACKAKLLDDMPVYVDNMDNRVNQAYVGWPTRIYFLDKEGRVTYDSGLGPYGFSPEELEKELSMYVGGN
ncbi:iodothyronine deiodinase [Desulfoluna butyratoxydans]|uniref:Iodothyronine deiodinase n=1 Tax=Desulfoluna butyratoxydans TaxID=231438 RepID=A0A4V6ILS7_9BACT|nr:deiodinase-like protein [Desulfoluna butyratoxydans]VFQ46308.1 iodothyronine deiodinase [Desulfoluna butyratoxydans]